MHLELTLLVDNFTAFSVPARANERHNRDMFASILARSAMALDADQERSTAQPSPEQVDRFFDDVYFKFNPTVGTSSGFHQYDAQLEDYSKAAVDAQVQALAESRKGVLRRWGPIPIGISS